MSITIKVKKDYKEFIDKAPHNVLSRRDFIGRGLATTVMTTFLPGAIVAATSRKAFAAATCPPAVKKAGSIVQFYNSGGNSFFSYSVPDAMAAAVSNPTTAQNYGVAGDDVVTVGPGHNMFSKGAYFAGVKSGLAAAGLTATEQTRVLSQTTLSSILGCAVDDDGGGDPQGHRGSPAVVKTSQLNLQVLLGTDSGISPWAQGAPSITQGSNPNVAALASRLGLTPATSNTSLFSAASTSFAGLTQIIGDLLMKGRAGASNIVSATTCGFVGDVPMASPSFGASVFDPSQITALSSKINTAQLTATELAELGAYFRSAEGTLSGIVKQFNGRDYHGTGTQNCGLKAFESGRSVGLKLAADFLAGSDGVLIFGSNGSAIANGIGPATININGTSTTVNAANAAGDAGGFASGYQALFYRHTGAPVSPVVKGSVASATGRITSASGFNSPEAAVAALYLSAGAFLGVNVSDLGSRLGLGTANLSKWILFT